MQRIKCLVIADKPIWKLNAKLYSRDTFPIFISNLSFYFQTIYYCAPLVETSSAQISFLDISSVFNNKCRLIKTVPYKGVLDYYRKFLFIFVHNFITVKRVLKNCDLIIIRIPTMNSFLVYLLAMMYNKPIVTYVVGSEIDIIRFSSKYSGFLRFTALLIADIHFLFYRKMVKRSLVSFFLSRKLMERFRARNAYFIFTSLIKRKDIIIRTPSYLEKRGVNILYVGRLTHEKGLKYLIQAVPILIDRGFNVKISLCGDGPECKKLQRLSRDLGCESNIEFLGFIPWGKELDKIYLQHDIFVLPSVSEGIPKVLLEAMAKGLPIIATNVGGIPDIIKDTENGILISPKSPADIARAVEFLVRNDDVRGRIINNSYNFVREHTAETQARKIANIINQHTILLTK